MTEVTIDGVLYVPAKTVIVDRSALLRALVEVFLAPEPDKTDEWFENQAKYLWVNVRDDEKSGIAILDLLDNFAKDDRLEWAEVK